MDRSRMVIAATIVMTIATASPAATAATVGGGAFGIAASVNAIAVPISIGPLPTTSLPPEGGGPFVASLLSTNALGLAPLGIASVSTEGNASLGSATSSASVADVSVLGLVSVKAARSECSATATGATGSASVLGLVVGGVPIATARLGPNATITLPIGTVVVNEQRRDAANGFVVDAVHVRVDALLFTGDIVVSQRSVSAIGRRERRRERMTAVFDLLPSDLHVVGLRLRRARPTLTDERAREVLARCRASSSPPGRVSVALQRLARARRRLR